MELRSYLDTLPRGGVRQFARDCEISEVYLLQLAAKQDGRRPSAKLCNVFVAKSGARLTYEDLRPEDWREIWPGGTVAALAGHREHTSANFYGES